MGVGRSHETIVGTRALLGGIGVAGSHDGGIDKAVLPLLGHKELGVAEFHLDGVAHHDVGDIHSEYVGATLLQQGGAFALLLGLFVVGAGFLLFLNLGPDGAVADGHLHGVDGGPGGHGEGVDGFEGVAARVDVDLPDGDIGYGAGNDGTGRGLLEGELVGFGMLADDYKVGREGFGVVVVVLRCKRTAYEQEHSDKEQGFAPKGLCFHGIAGFMGCLF